MRHFDPADQKSTYTNVLPSATFSILMSLSPAIATTAGFLILGQKFTGVAFVAIGLVIAASIGAVLSASRAARPGETGLGEPLA